VTRQDLAAHFAAKGYTRGAEIGVERGKFSEVLCESIPGLSLLAVDAWSTKPGYREHVTQQELDTFEKQTRKRLQKYGAHVVKGFSVDVARTVPDGSLDFVYIDADHAEAAVIADLKAWVPKVKRGGIVSGHDYNLSSVKRAVRDAHAGVVQSTHESSPSFWWVR
jgi:hypothetical protein